MKNNIVYEKSFNNNSCGFTIKKTKKGHLLEQWSNIQGDLTEFKVLIYFNNDFDKNCNFEEQWNEFSNHAEILISTWLNYRHKILKKGDKVQ